MGALPLVLAFSFTAGEQQLLGWAFLIFTGIGLFGYGLYKLSHVFTENWPKVDAGTARLVDLWFDRGEQILQRRAQLARLREQIQARSTNTQRQDEARSPG